MGGQVDGEAAGMLTNSIPLSRKRFRPTGNRKQKERKRALMRAYRAVFRASEILKGSKR